MSAPATSMTWKRSSPRGAGPPSFSAVFLSYSEPWQGQWNWFSLFTYGTAQPRCTHLRYAAATSSWARREALMRLRKGPRGIQVHARPAHRRADDGEHQVRGDEAGPDRDHPLARARAEETDAELHEHERQDEHDEDRDHVV